MGLCTWVRETSFALEAAITALASLAADPAALGAAIATVSTVQDSLSSLQDDLDGMVRYLNSLAAPTSIYDANGDAVVPPPVT
jgi:hypothetical protein